MVVSGSVSWDQKVDPRQPERAPDQKQASSRDTPGTRPALASSGQDPVSESSGQKKSPPSEEGGENKLATTYSHTAYRRTTIGAVAFHFRVRDGNGWCHYAMVTRIPRASVKKMKLILPDFWGLTGGQSSLFFMVKERCLRSLFSDNCISE